MNVLCIVAFIKKKWIKNESQLPLIYILMHAAGLY